MLHVGLRFHQWGGLGFLTLVFLFFFFDVACWASISPVGGGLRFLRLVFCLFLFDVGS